MINIEEGVLFELDPIVTPNTQEKKGDDRRVQVSNLQLYNSFPVEGREELPKVKAYNGPLPLQYVNYSQRKMYEYSKTGIHYFVRDYDIESTWTKPVLTLKQLQKYSCTIGPDFSLFVDQCKSFNLMQLYKNRWVTSYWQENGINAVPSASWGGANSFDYCFDGLPENSIIAIGHSAVGKTTEEKRLFRYAIKELVRQKHPAKLLVYGFPLDFDPIIDVEYIECFIQKIRNKCL